MGFNRIILLPGGINSRIGEKLTVILSILPVVPNDLPISPQFSLMIFFRDASSALLTPRQLIMVGFHLLITLSRFPLRNGRSQNKQKILILSRIELTTPRIYFSFSERAAWWGGVRCQFFFFFFPCSADHERD